MKKSAFVQLTLMITILLMVSPLAFAQPTYRGFQTSFSTIDVTEAQSLASFWRINLTRSQIGDNAEQDSVSNMEEYYQLLNPVLDQFDEYLSEVCPQGIQVWAALYSTPGGFANRSEGGQTPHLKIFTEQWAQEGFLDAWRTIAQRYSSSEYRDCIYGFELANETPMGRLPAPGLKEWRELMLDAIAVIRESLPNVRIITNPIFANPAKLTGLPIQELAADGNVLINVHAYPNVKYSHSGLDGIPTTVEPPSCRVIQNKFIKPLARYVQRIEKMKRKGTVPSDFALQFVVGEYAVTHMAKDQEVYFDRILSTLEGDGCGAEVSRPNRKKKANRGKKGKKGKKEDENRKRKKRRAWRNFVDDIRIIAHTNHAYGEAPIWDPRTDENGNRLDPNTGVTPKGAILLDYFSRNQQ